MRTRLVLARVAVGLALTTGLTGIGSAAAMAVETDELPLCGIVEPLIVCPEESPSPSAPSAPAPGTSTPPAAEENTPTPAESTPAEPGPATSPSAPSTPADTSAAPPAPVQSAPQQPQTEAPAPAQGPTTGGTPGGGTSAGTQAGSSTTTKSSVPSAAVTTAAPPVQLAPSGPALTSVESAAAGEAVERVRETLPSSVEPSTRLLAEPVSSGSGLPSPNDSGLLALIVAMGAASIGCAVAALLLRGRDKARHLS